MWDTSVLEEHNGSIFRVTIYQPSQPRISRTCILSTTDVTHTSTMNLHYISTFFVCLQSEYIIAEITQYTQHRDVKRLLRNVNERVCED